ncbi:MAG: hypothetical protein PUB73_02025 [Bacteroidales bacterium]|nr:hypothetical protein [Bacteroidales bacterium]
MVHFLRGRTQQHFRIMQNNIRNMLIAQLLVLALLVSIISNSSRKELFHGADTGATYSQISDIQNNNVEHNNSYLQPVCAIDAITSTIITTIRHIPDGGTSIFPYLIGRKDHLLNHTFSHTLGRPLERHSGYTLSRSILINICKFTI